MKTALAGFLLKILAIFTLMAGLCVQATNAQANGTLQKKMETYDLLVFSNPVAGAKPNTTAGIASSTSKTLFPFRGLKPRSAS